MDWERQGDLFDPDWTGPEGLFDAQMPLPFPTLERQVPFQAIIKRDGRHEELDRRLQIVVALELVGVELDEAPSG